MNETIPPNQARVERENIALSRKKGRPLCPADHYLIQVLDPCGQGNLVEIDDPVPTGRQILTAAKKIPVDNHLLLLIDDKGVLDEVNLDEPVTLLRRLKRAAFPLGPGANSREYAPLGRGRC